MRLFVAIDFPAAIKNQLVALQPNVPSARWVGRDQMHLTLFFIGETERLPAIKIALAGVQAPPFTLTLNGVVQFPANTRKPPSVLWVGLEPQPALMQLQQQIANALAQIGLVGQDHDFSPHVTLARLKTERTIPEITQFLEQHGAFRSAAIPVTQFALIASVLTPQGARYTHEAAYPLVENQ